MIETNPLEKAGEAYARMMSGKAQFRAENRRAITWDSLGAEHL